jgi:uncharacterized protein
MRVLCSALMSTAAVLMMASGAEGQARPRDAGGPRTATDHAVSPKAPRRVTPYPGGYWEPGPAKYGVDRVEGVSVLMDDGVALSAVVLYPTDLATGRRPQGRFPVAIEHTPYARPNAPGNTFLTEHGYIYVVVNARGTGKSGGEHQFYTSRDGRDGKAVVDWAAHRLEGSDGRIALVGCSAPGGLALADMAFVGPNSPVKAAVVSCNGLEGPYREAWFVSGMTTTGFRAYAPNAARSMGDSEAVKRFFPEITEQILSGGPPAYDNGYYDDRLPMRWANDISAADIPILLWTGWDDILETPAISTYTALQNARSRRPVYAPMAPNQPTTPRYQIIVGPWSHGAGLHQGIYLQWLETWLKGTDTGLQKASTPMHLFESGSNRWVNASRYPIVSKYTTFALDAGGSLARGASKGQGEDTLRYVNPDQPQGRLTYTTAPFAQGATLAGPVSATIYASTSSRNLVLIPKLYDVAPDGAQVEITRGAVMGSLREVDRSRSWTDAEGALIFPWLSLKKDDYLRPGELYRLEVPLAPRQYAVAPSHRLRLELISQNPTSLCPADLKPTRNIAEVCGLTAPQRASVLDGVFQIAFGRERPSALHLPLLPWKAMPEVASGTLPPAGQSARPEARTTHPLDWGFGGQK